jgi:hypothetical protein
VEAAQIDVQLSVDEAVRDPVGPVQGQRGLADAGAAGDRGDCDRGGRRTRAGTDRVEGSEFAVPAGEGSGWCR